jgi:ribonucleotide reductase alpha subunit
MFKFVDQAADAVEQFTGLTPSSTEIGIAFDDVYNPMIKAAKEAISPRKIAEQSA